MTRSQTTARAKARAKLNDARDEVFLVMRHVCRETGSPMFGDKLYALEHWAKAFGRARERWSAARSPRKRTVRP